MIMYDKWVKIRKESIAGLKRRKICHHRWKFGIVVAEQNYRSKH